MNNEENSPILIGERVYLRKMSEEDCEAMFALLQDPDVNTYLPWFPLEDMEETKSFLKKRYFDTYDNPRGYHYAICLQHTNELIGYIQVSEDESHDLGYAIAKAQWHHGYASEAAQLLLTRLKQVGYSYVTATHDRKNPRSGDVMKRLGMKYCYSYVEQWMPKNIEVTFRMYQLNFDDSDRVYDAYKKMYPHMIEK